MAGHIPVPVCLVCHSPVEVLDSLPPSLAQGAGWSQTHVRILVECTVCKDGNGKPLVRVYLEERTRLDEGSHIKRSLR